ncbi:hypothetical protein [Proteus phage PM2]|uniref:Uncharacterized protein n=1 Tax=Proteus phage PM2 TaxID=2025809 RepID=A0A249XWE1_9CAUD|nr:hypothetical protein KNT71_gp005 [Proteus phage PM2]ASZ76291.1 hypothetical protein [Proteus phage PM2]
MSIIKLLETPFNEWDAFKKGIINEKGDVIKFVMNDPSYTRLHKDVRWLKQGSEIYAERVKKVYEIMDDYNLDESFLEHPIIEEMIAGDSGGSTENIASGKTSGSITSKGPNKLGKKKKKDATN